MFHQHSHGFGTKNAFENPPEGVSMHPRFSMNPANDAPSQGALCTGFDYAAHEFKVNCCFGLSKFSAVYLASSFAVRNSSIEAYLSDLDVPGINR